MHYGITDLGTFVLGTIIIILLPGPNSMYVMATASKFGIGAGFRGAFGILAGDLILMVLAAGGAASLVQTTPALFAALKYAGALYLVYLGINLVRSALRDWKGLATAPTEQRAWDEARPFRVALTISLLNPKGILFFVSFFVQFVSPDYPQPIVPFLILGVIVQICSLLYLSALIFGGAYLASVFSQQRRLAALATGSVGGLFVAFGLRLARAGLG
ncbi:MAG TPA: leucine efflux protein LeuE [Gammaproteobacteria bacterium]|nr:leucine efflux protein LeuE [Gammaproteobacteria bacterium]